MELTAEQFARMMKMLLPPGRLWRLDAGSWLSKVLLAASDELVRVQSRGNALIVEADPRTTTELLPDFERVLDLEPMGTEAERRARVVARLVARQRFRPVDFQAALASILGQPAASVVVIERTAAQAAAMGDLDGREIFRFFIFRDPGYGGSYDLAAAQALVDQIKPSHTVGHVIESINFKCEDPFSLCDRDILGV